MCVTITQCRKEISKHNHHLFPALAQSAWSGGAGPAAFPYLEPAAAWSGIVLTNFVIGAHYFPPCYFKQLYLLYSSLRFSFQSIAFLHFGLTEIIIAPLVRFTPTHTHTQIHNEACHSRHGALGADGSVRPRPARQRSQGYTRTRCCRVVGGPPGAKGRVQRGQDGVRRWQWVLPAGSPMHAKQGRGRVRRRLRGCDAVLQFWRRRDAVLPAGRVLRLRAERVHAAEEGCGRRVDGGVHNDVGGGDATTDGAGVLQYGGCVLYRSGGDDNTADE